jgi:geranylgeranyl diphosphate synthase type II
MHFKQKIAESLLRYHVIIENKIEEGLESLGPPSLLKEACAYAIKNGGKRFRPALVLMIASALGERDASDSALAIEFFHTASLIADDLPCMDNDDERRNHPSLHKAFSETIAVLATYALISSGYDLIRKNSLSFPDLLAPALECATYNTGIFGATGGQYLDLFPPQNIDHQSFNEVIQKKTGTLFELSFVFGWLFGGGEVSQLPLVKKAAAHFGMAFQIVDDFFDAEDDRAKGRKINAVLVYGFEGAKKRLEMELKGLKHVLGELDLNSREIQLLVSALEEAPIALL